jgi:hypothetical protein
MKKIDELADPKSCLNTAADGDFVFVLKQKDPRMAATIRFWAAERVKHGDNEADDPKITTALLEARIVEMRQTGQSTEMLEAQLAKLTGKK